MSRTIRGKGGAPPQSKEGIDLKFSDGFWLNKPGYDIHYAVEPYELYVQDGKISVVATKAVIENRGQTLRGRCWTSPLPPSAKTRSR